MVKQVGVLEQELLEIVFGSIDNFLLMIIVDLLAIVLGQCFEALAAHKQNTNFGQLFTGCDETSLFEQFLELLLPSGGTKRDFM